MLNIHNPLNSIIILEFSYHGTLFLLYIACFVNDSMTCYVWQCTTHFVMRFFPVLQQIINASRIVLDCSTHGGLSFCCNSYLDSQWLPLLASSAVCRSCWKSSSSWDKGGLFILALHPSPLISHNYSRIRSIILEVDGSKSCHPFLF